MTPAVDPGRIARYAALAVCTIVGYFLVLQANLVTSVVAGVLWTVALVGGYRYLTRDVDGPVDP